MANQKRDVGYVSELARLELSADEKATFQGQLEDIVRYVEKISSVDVDGVPPTLPALLKAQRTQEKAARVGFDWKDASGPMEKIREETAELEEAIAARPSKRPADSDRVKDELGDLLFSVCNLARHLDVDAESALEGTSAKFARRFREVEAAAKEGGRSLKDMTLAEMDALWDAAKRGG